MLLLSHIGFSQSVEDSLSVEDQKEYYLGSLLPDIRYMNGSDRSLTHIPVDSVDTTLTGLSTSFLLGYKTHLHLDTWASRYGIYAKTRELFPMWIQRKLSGQLLNIFFEVYFFQILRNQSKLTISQKYSEIYTNIGVHKDDFSQYSSSIQRIFDTMSFDEGVSVVEKNPKLVGNKKIQLYMKLGRYCMKIPFVKEYITRKIGPVMEQAKLDFQSHIVTICT